MLQRESTDLLEDVVAAMLSEERVELKFRLNAVQLFLEGLVAAHHEVVQDVVCVGNGFKQRQNGRVSDHAIAQLSPRQRSQ